jgi:VIT1/CCC1 family predicted Fe2+/Mn2+ transporter
VASGEAARAPKIRRHAYHGDEPWHGTGGVQIREIVFGVEDGLVATLGLVTGVAAAHSDHLHVVVAGVAAAVANVVSMGVGSYISTRAQVDYQRLEADREWREIQEEPEREMAEMREIYTGYGFAPEEVDVLTRRFAADKQLWLEFMLRDELGILREEEERPLRNAITMALAVLVGAAVPVVPFLLPLGTGTALGLAFALSGLGAFCLGVGKSRVARGSAVASGLQFLVAAALAAAVGIGVGLLVSHLYGLSPAVSG